MRQTLLGSILLLFCMTSVRADDSAGIEFFEKAIRPVLVENCYQCHSATAEKLRGGLRLDHRAAAVAGGESGPALVPGNPEESAIVSAVRYESFEMPPKGRLAKLHVDNIVKWVEMGAPWPEEASPASPPAAAGQFDWKKRRSEHWSWQPLTDHQPPQLNSDWPQSPIDNFVLAKLRDNGLTTAKQANRRTIIRRLYFDLIGLPPKPEEIADFENDPEPDAYERLVDRLLKSAHFGEKWARHWMDLVRYGETCGHEFDYPVPHAWRYRDYLIRAFNADVPYDQLLTEHIAGDLMSVPRRHPEEGYNESIIGTGFWFLGEAVHAPTDVKADEADRIDNQIDVFSKTFLGLTVSCARCHDHKFDPISTEDYYALSGFLQSSRRQEAFLDPYHRIHDAAQQLRQLRDETNDAINGALAQTSIGADEFTELLLQSTTANTELAKRWQKALEEDELNEPTHPLFAWKKLVNVPTDAFVTQRTELANQLAAERVKADESLGQTILFEDFQDASRSDWFVTGEAFSAGSDVACVASPMALDNYSVAHSGLLSKKLHGVLRSKTFTLNHRNIHYRLNAERAQIRLIVDGFVMDIYNALLFQDATLEQVDTGGKMKWQSQSRDIYHYLGHRAHIEIIDHGDGFAAVDQIRFSDGGAPADPPSDLAVRALTDSDVATRRELAEAYGRLWQESIANWTKYQTDADQTQLIRWAIEHGLLDQPISDATERSDRRQAEIEKGLPAPIRVQALTDGSGEDEHVFIRGNHNNLGEVANRRLLKALESATATPIGEGSGRLQLAQRLLSPDNPFVARVIVNRLWHHLFGKGIVPSVDDFGAMGEPPSHPELLDWLAQDLVTNGWSLKGTIRRIVLSGTYRMSSQSDLPAELVARTDPTNRWLHKAPVRRLPAESIRDSLLAVSGRLDRKLYGKSVPVYLTSFMEGRGRPRSGPLDGDGRRSIYVEVRRNFLSPFMLTFDMPIPFNSMGRRSASNVPAQSLILMNDPFVASQAELFAKEILKSTNTAEERVDRIFESLLGRPPTPKETAGSLRFIERQTDSYGTAADELKTWKDLCHTVINMKEFIFIR